jgi:hypothetical protein
MCSYISNLPTWPIMFVQSSRVYYALGSCEGAMLGDTLGLVLGTEFGSVEGALLGARLGLVLLGTELGSTEGALLGARLGLVLGTELGSVEKKWGDFRFSRFTPLV